MDRLGLSGKSAVLAHFPSNPTTRKGNLAEVVLAEYLTASSGLAVPIYRLRYNPNVNQSMKGDDVLAFDLDADPVRIVVGEAKFRSKPSRQTVVDIGEALEKARAAGLPVSLQFVAERLFEEGDDELGERILECAALFALRRLRLDYVGLLLSTPRGPQYVDDFAPLRPRRLAMISLAVDDPPAFVEECYGGLE